MKSERSAEQPPTSWRRIATVGLLTLAACGTQEPPSIQSCPAGDAAYAAGVTSNELPIFKQRIPLTEQDVRDVLTIIHCPQKPSRSS